MSTIDSYRREQRASRGDSARYGGFSAAMPRPTTRRKREISRTEKILRLVGIALLFLGAVLMSGCCPMDRARVYAEQRAAINRAHARDKSLPLEARQVADDNARAWATQAFHLGGPAPVTSGSTK